MSYAWSGPFIFPMVGISIILILLIGLIRNNKNKVKIIYSFYFLGFCLNILIYLFFSFSYLGINNYTINIRLVNNLLGHRIFRYLNLFIKRLFIL